MEIIFKIQFLLPHVKPRGCISWPISTNQIGSSDFNASISSSLTLILPLSLFFRFQEFYSHFFRFHFFGSGFSPYCTIPGAFLIPILFWCPFLDFHGFPWISMDLQCFSDSSQIALFSCSRSFHIFSDFQILHSLRFCVILDLQYLFSCVYFKSFEMSPCFRLPSLHSDFVLSLSPAFLNSYNMTCVLGLGVAPGIPSYSTRKTEWLAADSQKQCFKSG